MTNDKPKISIFGSAHRPEKWMSLYNSIGNNDINFDIIFVGPNEPNFKLPDNFRFIKSNVKPVQCLEIAARNTMADLIINISDDMEFRTEKPIDKLYSAYKFYDNDKLILSCRYMEHGNDMSPRAHSYAIGNPESPIVPVSGLISRKLYMDIGGIDRNFLVAYWDLDIAMRVYAIGGKVILSNVYIDEPSGAGGLYNNENDRPFLDSVWTTEGKIHYNRTRPVESFSDLNILEESQGPKGKWI